jgi:hypothetical protein
VLVPVGRVDVLVSGDAAAARAVFADLVPPDAVLVAQGEPHPAIRNAAAVPIRAGIVTRDLPPWEGGMTIARAHGTGTAACQAGFVAQKDEPTGPDSYWLMTAGHCGGAQGDGINDEWRSTAAGAAFSTGYGIGWMRGQCYANGCAADVGVISMNSSAATNRVWLNANAGVSITSQQGHAADDLGDLACLSSSHRLPRGDYLCGHLNHLSYDATWQGVTLPYERRVDIRFIQAGDSGGPVWRGNQALGIIYGYTGDQPYGDLYSQINDAVTTAGLRAVKQTS